MVLLDELSLNQKSTAEEIILLRRDVSEFVRELKRDRMDLLEILQEFRQKEIPEPDTTPDKTPSERAQPNGKMNSLLGSLFSPKGLLAGISAAALALYAFRDDVSNTSKSFSDTILNAFPKFLRPGISDDSNPESSNDQSLTQKVTGNGERLLVRAARGEGATTAKKIASAVSPKVSKVGNALKERVVEKTIEKYGSAPEKAPKLQQKIMETATSVPKSEGLASKTIKSAAKTVVAGAGKSALKTLPLIGAVAGVAFGVQRLLDGDPVGAALDVSAGLAGGSGVGAPAAIAGNVYSLSRDVYNNVYGNEENKFPFEGDLISDPEMTKERMAGIFPAVVEAIKENQDSGPPTKSIAQMRKAQRSRGKSEPSTSPSQVAVASDPSTSPSQVDAVSEPSTAATGIPRAGTSTRQQVSEPLIQGTMDQIASTGSVTVNTVNAPSNVTTQNNVAQTMSPGSGSPVTGNSSKFESWVSA